jgi:hypothetical protein
MTTVDDARSPPPSIRRTRRSGSRAAAQYTEITTGDLDALTTVQFDDAVERAAREWLRLNDPRSNTAE